jgi:hypothetical protein
MTPPSCEGPPRPGDAAGSSEVVCLAASPSNNPSPKKAQTKNSARRRAGRPNLRVVASNPPRLIEVRLTAIAGLYPYGGVTRSFALSRDGLKRLIEVAERIEAVG